MPTKVHLIDHILQINPSARPQWLDLFDASALRRYLDHLHHAIEPRGGESYWIRNAETPAIVTRRPAA